MSPAARSKVSAGVLVIAVLTGACSDSTKPVGPWCQAQARIGELPPLVAGDDVGSAEELAVINDLAALEAEAAERAPDDLAADARLLARFTEAVANRMREDGLGRLAAFDRVSEEFTVVEVDAARSRLAAFASERCLP